MSTETEDSISRLEESETGILVVAREMDFMMWFHTSTLFDSLLVVRNAGLQPATLATPKHPLLHIEPISSMKEIFKIIISYRRLGLKI